MEREVSMVVEIGVALIALSAFIFILWVTVFMGEDMANSVGQEATNILGTTQSGALEEYTEHLPAGMGDANIKDICVTNGIVYAVGCKVSSGTETKNGVIYSCNLEELLSNSAKNDGTSTEWGAVDTCATKVKASNGEIVAESSVALPALKAVAATAEID